MLNNSGIQIHFSDTGDNLALGVSNGIGTYLEGTGEIPIGINYVNNIFPEKWNGGFSDKFDIRTHVRPQNVSDTRVVLSNARGIFTDLIANGYNPEGKRVEFVFYTDDVAGEYFPAPSMSVKEFKVTSATITLTLSDITTQQHTELSRPIKGDIWEPLIIGDHEYGVFVSNGGGFVPINEDRNWDMVVTTANSNLDAKSILTGTMNLDFVPSPPEGAPLEYFYDMVGNVYFQCTSGDGEGKSVKTKRASGSVSTKIREVTVNSVYHDVDGNGIFAGTTASQMTAETSVGAIGNYLTKYISDPNIASASTRLYNKNKQPISGESLILNGSTASVDAPTIEDGNIKGYPIIDFTEISYVDDRTPDFFRASSEQAWTYEGYGVWVGSDVSSHDNTPDSITLTGTADNMVDADDGTSHNVNLHYDTNPTGSYGAGNDLLTCQMFYVNNPEDIEKLLSDIDVSLVTESDDPDDVRKRLNITIHVHAFWEESVSWLPISDPVEIMSASHIAWPSPNPKRENIEIHAKSFIPSYYGIAGTNVEFDVNQGQYYLTAGSPNPPVEMWLRGSEAFTLDDGLFDATQKKPSGYIVSIDTRYIAGYGISAPAASIVDLDIKVRSIAGYRKETTVSLDDFILSEVEGRPYTTFKLYQEHLTKLLNWSLNFKTKPSEGWGLAECTDAPYSFSVNNATPVRSQWTTPSNLTAKKQLEIIQRESWNVMINTSAGKVWSDFLDKFGAESPSYSYEHRLNCNVKSAIPFDEQDIYNSFLIEYDYDISTGSYNKSISITQTTQDSYSTDYVSGITDPSVASNLWAKCNVLAGVVGSEKKFPENLSKLRNIYTEAGAIAFVTNSIFLSGVNGGTTYNPSYIVTAIHPVDDLFVSSSMSTIGYTKQGVWGGSEATGVITGRKYIPSPKSVEITSIVKPVFTVGRIIELETNTDRIIEDETNINRIVEVEA